MRPNISITLITPHVTIERYSELTGLSIDTINDMLADGRLNEVASEKMPHYVLNATAEIGRVAAGAVSGEVKTTAGRRDVISSINSVTRLMALTAVSLQARLQANPAMASAVDTVTGLGASFGLI